MRINYNATAMLAVNALNKNDENVAVSTGKLSSGYKINRAKDNPSGYAMSRKMHAQLEGMMQATDNTDTGINIIKAVDGALSEVHDMLQRLNELAIKGANGTLSGGDREIVDEEVQKLKEEIQRISETFEFNGQTLLDGSFQLKGYVDGNLSVKVAGYNDRMRVGEYTINLNGLQEARMITDPPYFCTDPLENCAHDIVRDFTPYDKNGNLIAENIYDMWREKVTVPANPTDKADPKTTPAIWNKDTQEWGYKEDGVWKELPEDWKETVEVENHYATDTDTKLTVTGPDGITEIEPVYVSDANGKTITIKGPNGFELKLDITKDFVTPDANPDANPVDKNIKINLTGLGAMTVQVGANEGQEIAIEIPDIGVKALGINLVNTATKEDSLEAITRVSVAINRLSGIRSKLGAYQNRLESVVDSSEINHENMTAAYSGILDVDMSEEYTKYSTYQILAQASTSVLAQANERPSQILQLLQ